MRREAIGIAIAAALLGGGCNGVAGEGERILPAGTISLQPAALGQLERPAVELPHDKHVVVLAKEGCTACHPKDPKGRLSLRFGRVDELTDRNALVDLYHERCTSCHKKERAAGNKSGPTTCGECHRRGNAGSSRWARRPMSWDYALHDRHLHAEERCERCHHVKDPATGKPVYKKGAEEGCRACHEAKARPGSRSLREAAHLSCVPCHLDRQQRHAEAGPVTCGGCHGEKPVTRVSQEPIRRLLRNQRDIVAIRPAAGAAAKQPGVSFDHKTHEGTARFCSTCHHKGLAACASCHTVVGSARGKGVTFETAYHDAASERSCVGCHARQTAKQDCAGCHDFPLGASPTPSSCAVCHGSPPSSAPSSQPIALPATSESFPETVTISTLQKKYGPSVLPHRKIVARLVELANKSPLARRFHGRVETLCAGCHHRSPAAARPPGCQSCHGREPGRSADPRADKPGLTAAYHRQCIGCHESMKIGRTGCTDCHKAGSTEAGR
jgi:hypothetical protein